MIKNIARLVSPRPEEPAQVVDPLATLLAERDAIAGTLTRFARFAEAIGAANATRDMARQALRDFDAQEVEALRNWAEGGDGEAPERDRARRAALVEALDAAEREVEAAELASRTVEPSHRRALGALDAVAMRIDEFRANAIAAEAQVEVEELARVMLDATKRLARITAAREALFEASRSFADIRAPLRAQPWATAAARLADVPSAIQVRPNLSEIEAEAAPWRAKVKGK